MRIYDISKGHHLCQFLNGENLTFFDNPTEKASLMQHKIMFKCDLLEHNQSAVALLINRILMYSSYYVIKSDQNDTQIRCLRSIFTET